MIVYQEDGMYTDEYVKFMGEEVLPELRRLIGKVELWLVENEESKGIDFAHGFTLMEEEIKSESLSLELDFFAFEGDKLAMKLWIEKNKV